MSECTFAKYSLCTEHSGDPGRQMKQRDRKLPLSTVAKGSETKDKIIKLSPLLSADNQNPQNMSGASYALSFLVLTRLISTHSVSPLSSPSSGSPPWNYIAFLYYKPQTTYASLHIHITIRMLLFMNEIILLMPIYPARR